MPPPHGLAHALRRRVDRRLVGDVDLERLDAARARRAQALGVLVAAHPGEHLEAEEDRCSAEA